MKLFAFAVAVLPAVCASGEIRWSELPDGSKASACALYASQNGGNTNVIEAMDAWTLKFGW